MLFLLFCSYLKDLFPRADGEIAIEPRAARGGDYGVGNQIGSAAVKPLAGRVY